MGEIDNETEESFIHTPGNTHAGNKIKIRFKMIESIVAMERKAIQKKAVVIQLGVDFKMTMNDQRAIERQIEN